MNALFIIWLGCAAFGATLWFQAMMFLWHGSHYFREQRRRMADQLECIKCHAVPSRPDARYCGKCGGQLMRAA